MADKTKLIWVNGSTIKQGDTSSIFKLKLLPEDNAELNGPAKLQLIDRNKAKVEYDVDVVDNIIEFKLDRVLPADAYIVEVEHAGYVFPSADLVTLKVTENQGDYITDEIVGLLSIDEYIKQKLADFQSGQIDLDELASKLTISQYDDSQIKAQINEILAEIESLKQPEDSQTSYDDSELRSQIRALSELVDKDTVYDDSELREKIQTLEDREDHDTTYTAGAGLRLIGTEFSVDEASLPQGPKGDVGETGPQGETGLAGADGKSAYRIWLEHGGRGTEEDFLNSLKATSSSPNRPPTGFSLDRSTTPYQFCFDNGCRLALGNVDSRAYIRQDITDIFAGNLSEYRVAMSIIRTANGSVGIDNWQSANSIARFWNDAEVIHPVNDASGFNFDNAYYNINDTSGPSRRNQSRLIKCYFELGVFTESDIQSFGAIKL
ncbi:hypothetical protein [Streptococcus suis]